MRKIQLSKNPVLSVLIPTTPDREEKLQRLLNQIWQQGNNPIEVIIHDGDQTTGEKRNDLLKEAIGEYVEFQDSDDEQTPNHYKRILPYLDGKIAAVGYIIEFRFGKKIMPMICSPAVTVNKHYPECIFKCVTHIQPIKRELCVPFRHITKGEDVYFNREMVEVLKDKRCTFINETLYYYNCH